MRRALVVVDIQNDFCEDGSLGVAGGNEVAGRAASFVERRGGDYDLLVATRDWHIEPGDHFSEHPDFVDSWPRHCEADSPGAAFHPDFAPVVDRFHTVVSKGQRAAAYSGFEGITDDGRSLASVLRDNAVEAIDVAGIATDYCVRATALDARQEGFTVRVLADLCAAVDPEKVDAIWDELRAAGAEIALKGEPIAEGRK